jgi:hypothetical protein
MFGYRFQRRIETLCRLVAFEFTSDLTELLILRLLSYATPFCFRRRIR